jgi:hypothetical protein
MLESGMRAWPALLNWRQAQSIPVIASVFGCLVAGQLLANVSLHPVYQTEGDLPHHQLWFGIYHSLQINPEWDVKYLSSVNGAVDDAMPTEAVKIAIAKLPPEEQKKYWNDAYGAPTRVAIEKFSRQLFFEMLRDDPQFVLATFFIYKPWRMQRTVVSVYESLIPAIPGWMWAIIVGTLIAVAFTASRDQKALRFLPKLSAVVFVFAVLASLPNWLVALNPIVMIDHFVWTILAAGLAVIAACAGGSRAVVALCALLPAQKMPAGI